MYVWISVLEGFSNRFKGVARDFVNRIGRPGNRERENYIDERLGGWPTPARAAVRFSCPSRLFIMPRLDYVGVCVRPIS